MGKSINKHIRVDEGHWKRIEKEAHKRGISPSKLMITATLEAIEGQEWSYCQKLCMSRIEEGGASC